MKKINVFLTLAALLLFVLFACNEEAFLNRPDTDSNPIDLRNKESCFNFKVSAALLPVGCACIPDPLVCPPGDPVFCNFGAKAFPVTIGEYAGFMASVVTSLEQMGNNGALQLTLHHYFVTEDGQSAFWTEDQVVCAPASGVNSCLINDVLDIIGGCGVFEGVSGKFHNHGLLVFDGGAELCPIFYLEGGMDYVPTGTVDANLHGRICLPE